MPEGSNPECPKGAIKRAFSRLHAAVTTAIEKGIKLEWDAANAETDKLIGSLFGKRVLNDENFRGWLHRNNDARRAFIERTDQGMNLSDRVWKSTRQLRDEMEVAMTVAIGEGDSAGSMSRKVRQYLNDPDLMFRRFRYKDEEGNWQLKWKKRITDPDTGKHTWIDYDKDSYRDKWTGPGYYKSSAKNAMRVTRTETNMAYRAADNARWEQLDFILGIHIQPSESHPQPDICDMLAGDYPKTFKFSGWHPQCFCIMTPILPKDEELVAMADARANGEEYTPETDPITDYPKGFKDFVQDNAENIRQARLSGTEPYFLRDNRDEVNKTLRYADKIKIGDEETTVWNMMQQCRVIETERGKVYLHPNHGINEQVENIRLASWRANNFGEEVILLPNPQGVKSADSFNITRGVMEEYKCCTAPTRNSLAQQIRSAKDQADYVVVELHPEMSHTDALRAIKGRITDSTNPPRCPNLKELRLKIGEHEAVYTREQIVANGFKIRPEDFHMGTAFRNEGSSLSSSEAGSISTAKLSKFFNTTKSETKKVVSEADAIEKALGIKRGKPRTIDEVFGTVNPDYDPKNTATTKNCSCCTFAAELRMRGYDVTAAHRQGRIPATLEEEYRVRHQIGYIPRATIESPTMQRASSSGSYGWIDPATGEPPTALKFEIPKGFYNTRVKELTQTGLSRYDAERIYFEELKALRLSELKAIIPEDGRYDIMVSWKSGGGHSMMLIKEGDEFSIYCHQTKCQYSIGQIFSNHATDKPLRLLRIDNLAIDADKVKDLVMVNGVNLGKKELEELLASTDFSELKKKMGRLWMDETELKKYLLKHGKKR